MKFECCTLLSDVISIQTLINQLCRGSDKKIIIDTSKSSGASQIALTMFFFQVFFFFNFVVAHYLLAFFESCPYRAKFIDLFLLRLECERCARTGE